MNKLQILAAPRPTLVRTRAHEAGWRRRGWFVLALGPCVMCARVQPANHVIVDCTTHTHAQREMPSNAGHEKEG
jgi:hypothetical protein